MLNIYTSLPTMTTIEPIDDDEIEDDALPIGEVKLLREQLEARCKAAKLKIEDTEGYEDGQIACRLGIPSGREQRWIYCLDYGDYRQILSVPFERYVFLHGLDAVCDYASGKIEAIIRSLTSASNLLIYRKVFGISRSELADRPAAASISLSSPAGAKGTTITLGAVSQDLAILAGTSQSRHLSIQILRDGLERHDQALELLRRTADALFFQIDLLSDVSLTLAKDRRSVARRKVAQRPSASSPIAFPTHEYDAAPISLYWYARSAVGMPLLQFLAYYQVIEFYYPAYSQAEARRKIKSILKDPGFRGDRDADLGRLLSAIHVTRAGGFGDERSQLRATLMECTDAEALRQFLTSEPERMEFLSAKGKGFAEHRLPIANVAADLRADVADRIYEIRCKIVHTKTDAKNGEFDLLLPFSKESEQLFFDIELAQYVAQQVLIAASTPYQV